jgi:hypothetical protein
MVCTKWNWSEIGVRRWLRRKLAQTSVAQVPCSGRAQLQIGRLRRAFEVRTSFKREATAMLVGCCSGIAA